MAIPAVIVLGEILMRHVYIHSTLGIFLIGSLWMSSAIAADTRALWHDVTAPAPATAAKTGLPKQSATFRTLTLDFNDLKNAVADVPFANAENTGISSKSAGSTAPVTLALPLPEGTGFTEFKLYDSGTLPPTLAQRYPEIRSLRG